MARRLLPPGLVETVFAVSEESIAEAAEIERKIAEMRASDLPDDHDPDRRNQR